MLTYRRWRAGWDSEEQRPVLYSVMENTPWPQAHRDADVSPAHHPVRGLYSYLGGLEQLPSWPQYELDVVGALEAYGDVVVHKDGLVRSQHARIVALAIEPSQCGHQVALVHTGVLYWGEDRDYKVTRCFCPHGGWEWWSPEPPEEMPLHEYEKLLLQAYDVPRLPIVPSLAK